MWLPGTVSQSVLRDVFEASLPSLASFSAREHKWRRRTEAGETAARWTALLQTGQASNRAGVAKMAGVTRARVTQVLGPRQVTRRDAAPAS